MYVPQPSAQDVSSRNMFNTALTTYITAFSPRCLVMLYFHCPTPYIALAQDVSSHKIFIAIFATFHSAPDVLSHNIFAAVLATLHLAQDIA